MRTFILAIACIGALAFTSSSAKAGSFDIVVRFGPSIYPAYPAVPAYYPPVVYRPVVVTPYYGPSIYAPRPIAVAPVYRYGSYPIYPRPHVRVRGFYR